MWYFAEETLYNPTLQYDLLATFSNINIELVNEQSVWKCLTLSYYKMKKISLCLQRIKKVKDDSKKKKKSWYEIYVKWIVNN